jgi:hypothetical protein
MKARRAAAIHPAGVDDLARLGRDPGPGEANDIACTVWFSFGAFVREALEATDYELPPDGRHNPLEFIVQICSLFEPGSQQGGDSLLEAGACTPLAHALDPKPCVAF